MLSGVTMKLVCVVLLSQVFFLNNFPGLCHGSAPDFRSHKDKPVPQLSGFSPRVNSERDSILSGVVKEYLLMLTVSVRQTFLTRNCCYIR